VVVIVRSGRATALGVTEVIASVVTGLFLVSLFVTGALVSIDKPMPPIVATAHHILPYLALASSGVTLYLLGRAV